MSGMHFAFAAVRRGVLSKLRLQPAFALAETAAPAVSLQFLRGFADASFLNKNEVTERVLNVLKHSEKVEKSKVTPTAKFQEDLGLDSLDVVELVMAIEEEFAIEIPDSEADKILATSDAISYIATNPMAK